VTCLICGNEDLVVEYEGKIRVGKYRSLSDTDHRIMRCTRCGCACLPDFIGKSAAFYETEEYRNSVDGSVVIADFHKIHDREQSAALAAIGLERFRDKTVMDVGCGGGSFLDAVRGYAKDVVAIEPAEHFHAPLRGKGYRVFPYLNRAADEYGGKIDTAVCLSVIEHIDNPLDFLGSLRRLLAPGGSLFLSTPNSEDLLLALLGRDYQEFFYRRAHVWYFDSFSLAQVLSWAGFRDVVVRPRQRFGLSNFLCWMRDRAPKGDAALDGVTKTVDAVWKSELERTGRCDYLYAEAKE
jgi:2-polyprenyl-3-methyl-5-hydroxy-6-metoxy-1,4-benzoquinol methylase